MKALVLTGVKEFEIQDLPTPEIQPNEVLINTAYAGVCGTDHDLYAGRPGSAAAVPPIVLGHENSGVVAAIGSEVTGVKVGDRVAVDPNIYCGQCEYCLTQRPELCDHLSAVGVTRDGGLAEQFTAPATVEIAAMHQWKKGGLNANSTPLFTGSTQFPCCNMERATTASRGSPRVLKNVCPKNKKRDTTHNATNGQK